MRLSPLDPMNFNVLFGIGGAHNVKREDEEAIPWLERGLEQKPDACWGYRALAASYAHTGRLEEAKRAVAILREAYPGLTISTVLAHTPVTGEHSRRFSEGLRKAGLPE